MVEYECLMTKPDLDVKMERNDFIEFFRNVHPQLEWEVENLINTDEEHIEFRSGNKAYWETIKIVVLGINQRYKQLEELRQCGKASHDHSYGVAKSFRALLQMLNRFLETVIRPFGGKINDLVYKRFFNLLDKIDTTFEPIFKVLTSNCNYTDVKKSNLIELTRVQKSVLLRALFDPFQTEFNYFRRIELDLEYNEICKYIIDRYKNYLRANQCDDTIINAINAG
jgi:hypothetical protein